MGSGRGVELVPQGRLGGLAVSNSRSHEQNHHYSHGQDGGYRNDEQNRILGHERSIQ